MHHRFFIVYLHLRQNLMKHLLLSISRDYWRMRIIEVHNIDHDSLHFMFLKQNIIRNFSPKSIRTSKLNEFSLGICLIDSIRTCKTSRQSCRSPVFARRPPQDQTITDNDDDSPLSHWDSSIPSMALTSLDTNGILPNDEPHSNNKRSLESPSSEQVLIKRRYQKSVPSNFSLLPLSFRISPSSSDPHATQLLHILSQEYPSMCRLSNRNIY